MIPEWLPEILTFNGASIEEDYQKLYAVFKRDFIDNPPLLEVRPVLFERAPDRQDNRYPHGFVHLITHNMGGQRFIEYERACRLPWVKAVIEQRHRPEISFFAARQATKNYGIAINYYLWLEQLSFVVILRDVKRGGCAGKMIITAYNTDKYSNKKLVSLRERFKK